MSSDKRKNLQGVYNSLKESGYTPPEFETFEKDMANEDNLRRVYNNLKKEGYTPPEFDVFKSDMGFGITNNDTGGSPRADFGEGVTVVDGSVVDSIDALQGGAAEEPWRPTDEEKARLAAVVNESVNRANRVVGAFNGRVDALRERRDKISGFDNFQTVKGNRVYNPVSGEIEDRFITPTGDVYDNKLLADRVSDVYAQEAGMRADAERERNEPIRGFGESFMQGSNALGQGLKNLGGETANLLFTGSQNDYSKALEFLDEMQASGYDLSNYDYENALKAYKERDYERAYAAWQGEIRKRREERKGMGLFDSIRHRWNDPDAPVNPYDNGARAYSKYRVADEVSMGRAFRAIGDALEESHGDVNRAKGLLESRSTEESWGDRVSREAREELSNMRPTEGFGAWAGGLVPQMVGNVAALGAQLSPWTRWLSKPLAYANMGALTASTAGSSMADARESGAGDGDVWRAGVTDAAIELATEKIPFDRYFGRLKGIAGKQAGKAIGDVVGSNPKGMDELTKLLKRAKVELPGGKLVTANNIREFLVDVGTEGFSEFLAEGLQGLTPMMYQNPEDYPTLMEVLDNAWEGAKGGFFMGGILGSGSNIINNRQHKQRRKEQGVVSLAEIPNGEVVELLGQDGDNFHALNREGKVVRVSKGDVVDVANVTSEEFERGVVDREIFDAYNHGHNATGAQEMADIANMYAFQRERMVETYGADVLAEVDENPYGAVDVLRERGWNDADLARVMDYVEAREVNLGMLQRVEDDIVSEIEVSNSIVASRANTQTGMVQGATLKEDDRRVYIKSGNVVPYSDGTGIDVSSSDGSIVVRDAVSGEDEMVSPDAILSVDEAQDATLQAEIAAEEIRNRLMDVAQRKMNGVVSFHAGDVYRVTGEDGSTAQIEVVANEAGVVDNGDGTVNVSDGRQVIAVDKSWIQEQVSAANMARVVAFEAEREAVKDSPFPVDNPSVANATSPLSSKLAGAKNPPIANGAGGEYRRGEESSYRSDRGNGATMPLPEYNRFDRVTYDDGAGNVVTGVIEYIDGDDIDIAIDNPSTGMWNTFTVDRAEIDAGLIEAKDRGGNVKYMRAPEEELVDNNLTESPEIENNSLNLQQPNGTENAEVSERISQRERGTEVAQDGRMEEVAIRLQGGGRAGETQLGGGESSLSRQEVDQRAAEANKLFNDELKKFEEGRLKGDLHLGTPSNALLASGLNGTEIFITPKTLQEHLKKHNLTTRDITNLPYALQNPLLIYDWGTDARSMLAITEIPHGDNRITVAIKLVRGGKQVEINELASIHPKDADRFLSEMRDAKAGGLQEALRWVGNKEKALDWLGLVPPEGTASLTPQEQSVANIIESFENPSVGGDNRSNNPTFEMNSGLPAFARIPKDRGGNPIYERAESADLAWDALVEESDMDVDIAQEVANDMVADKRKAVEKAKKMTPKSGTTPAEKIAARREIKYAIEDAERVLAIWERIAGVQARRKQEAEAETRRVAEELAAKRRAEEERLQGEREEAARIEREALQGVSDMVDDTAQDARARGYRRVNGHKVDRQGNVKAILGKDISVKFSNDAIPEGRVAVIDAGELQPSHVGGVRNPYHFIDEAQPKERNDEASVASAERIAGDIRPEEITGSVTAYTGAPTVNIRGEVIQGNNRGDALRLMWERYPEQAAKYKEYLKEHAEDFGLNAEDIDAMERPVVVNMVDVDDAGAIVLGQHTSQDIESGGKEPIKPINVVRRMGKDIRTFANLLLKSGNEESTFAELLNSNGAEVLRWMNTKGYITPTQYQTSFDSKENLTDDAKIALRRIMYQSIFQGGNTGLEEMFNTLPAKAQKAILATAYRDYDSPSGEHMIDELQRSIRAYYALSLYADFVNAKNWKEARMAVEAWKRQMQFDDVTGESYLPAENFSNFALHLATMYKGESQSLIQGTFTQLYDLIQGSKQGNLFEESDNSLRTLGEAIKEVLNIDYNGEQRSDVLVGGGSTGQQGEQGGDGALAPRERVESGDESTDGGRGAERDSGRDSTSREVGSNQSEEKQSEDVKTLIDVVRTLYSKGKEVARQLYQRSFFDVAQTPEFMQELGLRGDKFTIKYGVIARHIGKDGSHTLSEKDWEQLPQALQNPFAITKRTDQNDSYRIYTTLQTDGGEYVVVGVDVKNAGRELEVNAVSTVFGRRNNANLPKNEEVIYESKEITPEQSSLLERPNFAQYPTAGEFSTDKGSENIETSNAESEKSAENGGDRANKSNRSNGSNRSDNDVSYDIENGVMIPTPAQVEATDAVLEMLADAGIEVSMDVEEMAKAFGNGAQLQAKLSNLAKAANTIRDWLENGKRNQAFSIDLPGRVQNMIRQKLGEQFNEHIITANSIAHAKKNHGIKGRKNDARSIPLSDKDFELLPYVMTAPDRVEAGSMDSSGRWSVRFYKMLSNGQVIVVEKEQKNSPNDMETITMWAELSSNVPDARAAARPLNSTSQPATVSTADARTVIISTDDVAKIRKDAEDAIARDEILQLMTVYHGSGAEFDAFDHSHMGEGEGAQAYGWGSYVTEVKGIARSYAETGGKNFVNRINRLALHVEKQKDFIKNRKRDIKKNEDYDKYARSIKKNMRTSEKGYKLAQKEGNAKDMEFYQSLINIAEVQLEPENHKHLIDSFWEDINNAQEDIDKSNAEIEELKIKLKELPRNVYTVEIPEDNGSNYLEWNETISEEKRDEILSRLSGLQNDESFDFDEFTERLSQYEDEYNLTGEGLYNLLSRYGFNFNERKASEALHNIGFVGIKYPAQYTTGGRADNAKNYVIFNEGDLKITDRTQFLRTSRGEVYGFTKGGKIYLDPKLLNPNTPIHEYTHLWDAALQRSNPELWRRGVELMKQTSLWEDVKNNPAYADIAEDDDLLASEVHARLTGREGAAILDRLQEEARNANGVFEVAEGVTLVERLRRWINEAWQWVKDTMAPWTKEEADAVSLEEFVNMPIADLASGKKLGDVGSERTQLFSENSEEEIGNNGEELQDRSNRLDKLNRANYQREISNAQYAKAQEIVDALYEAGFQDFKISRSITGFGVSTYIQGDLGLKIRLSDHSVTSTRRLMDEIHINMDTPVDDVIEVAKRTGRRRDDGVELSGIDKNRNKRIEEKWDRISPMFDGMGFHVMDRTYQDLGEFIQKHPNASNILQTSLYGGAYRYEWSEPKKLNSYGNNRPSRGYIEAYDDRSGEMLSVPEQMVERVNELATLLHLDNVEVLTSTDGLEGKDKEAKGFYNKRTGKITIVIPNHSGIADVEQSLLHEAVAHYGLREMFGKGFDTFLDNVFNHAEVGIRREITGLAAKHGWEMRKATEEYLAGLAERTNFEGAKESGWWQRIKDFFMEMLDRLGFSTYDGPTLTDNELRYILWRSYENLREGKYSGVFGLASDVAMQYGLGVGVYQPLPPASTPPIANGAGGENNTLDEVNERFNEELERYENGEMGNNEMFHLGMPNGVMKMVLPELPIVMRPRIVNKSSKTKHHVDIESLKDLPKMISNPIFIFNRADNALGILTEIKDKNGLNVCVAIELNKKIQDGGEFLEVNDIRSIHGRDNANIIKPIVYNNTLVYANKEKGLEWLSSASYNYQQEIDKQDLDSATKIVESFENPSVGGENSNAQGESDDVLYRDDDPEMHERVLARDQYEERVKRGMFQTQESLQDSMLGLKEAMQAILGRDTHIEDVSGYENAYLGENRLSSVNKAEADAFAYTLFKPMLDEVARLAPTADAREELTDYMMAKHGLERNRVMAEREADRARQEKQKEYDERLAKGEISVEKYDELVAGLDEYRERMYYGFDYTDKDGKQRHRQGFRERDYAGLTALTGEDSVAKAEAEAQYMVDSYEDFHDTTDLWNRVNAVSKAILSKSYECGLMNDDTYRNISSMYEFYIPLRGFDERTSAEAYAYLTHSQSAFNAPIKKAKGRSSKADDPFANLQSMAESAIMQGNRNKLVKQKFLNFALNHPSDLVSVSQLWLQYDAVTDDWQPVFPDNIELNDTPEEVERKMREFEDKMNQLAEAAPDHYKRGKDAVNIPYRVVDKRDLRQHQVVVKRDGVDYVITINGNPRAAQALNGETNPDNDNSGAIGALLRAGEKINRQLSAFYTTRNPDFIVSNFMRDMLYTNSMVWVKESANYALRFHRNVGKANPAMLKILLSKHRRNELDMSKPIEAMFYQFIMNGGETGYANIRDIERHKNDIQRELKKLNGKINVARAWDLLGERFDELNRAVENCARFAAFMTSREMGRSIDRSIYDAKEISVNFNKKGSGAKFYDAVGQTRLGNYSSLLSGLGRSGFVFWNAAIQGSTNFGRQLKRHPAKAFTGAATMFLLGALIAYLGGDDEEEDTKNSYYNLPDYVRRSHILFGVGEHWVSLPLPIEYRAFYGMGELMISILNGKEHFTGGEIASAIAGQATQVLPIDFLEGGGGLNAFVPSAVKPLWEAYVIEKSWTGLPLYKDTPYNKDMPEWTKAYKGANKYIVGLADVMNEATGGDPYTKGAVDINPAKVEYMLNGYFGGVFGTIDKLAKTAETISGSREYDPRSILLLNRLVKAGDERTEYRAINNEYFRLKEEHDRIKNRLRNYERDTEKGIFDYAEKIDFLYHSPEFARYEIFEGYRPTIDNFYKQLKDVTDEFERKDIESELNDVKREMIGLIDMFEKGKFDTPEQELTYKYIHLDAEYDRIHKALKEYEKEQDSDKIKAIKGSVDYQIYRRHSKRIDELERSKREESDEAKRRNIEKGIDDEKRALVEEMELYKREGVIPDWVVRL